MGEGEGEASPGSTKQESANMSLKTFRVTFESGEQRLGTGYDPIGAICTAVKIANAERRDLGDTAEPTTTVKLLNSRNVVRVEQLGVK
jgi:hypothetical protein